VKRKQKNSKNHSEPGRFQSRVVNQAELENGFETAVYNGLSAYLSGPKPVFLAALSGGADSTAMVAALAAIRDKLTAQNESAGQGEAALLNLHCLHVNHGIRPPESSGEDQAASAGLCKTLGVPFSVTAIPPGEIEEYARHHGTGIEAAARHFRHAALREEAKRLGADALLVAHTASDRLETILMAFLRGASPAGLGAMSSHSSQTTAGTDEKTIPIVRPLLSVDRAAVLAYLKARNLSYSTDETNADESFLRNKIRLRLIPFLDEHFPGWKEPVLRLGETQAMTADFLRDEAARLLPWQTEKPPAFLQGFFPQSSALGIPAEQFFSQPLVLREEALFGAIDLLARGEETGKKPKREPLRAFVRGEETAADLGQCRIENKKGRVVVKKAGKAGFAAGFSLLIKKPGVYKLKGLTVKASSVQADSSPEETGFFAGFPLVLRSSSGGTILAEKRQCSDNGAWFTVHLDGGFDAGSK